MILFWKSGSLGKLWIDESALRSAIEPHLPSGTSCRSVQLFGDRDLLNVYVAIPSGTGTPDADAVRRPIAEVLAPLGLNVSVSLVAEPPDAAAEKSRHPLLRSPIFWGFAVGTLVAIFNLGLSGLFWVLFFGFAAFGIAWLFLTTAGRERLASFLDNFEE
jgi:hypothetical protein